MQTLRQLQGKDRKNRAINLTAKCLIAACQFNNHVRFPSVREEDLIIKQKNGQEIIKPRRGTEAYKNYLFCRRNQLQVTFSKSQCYLHLYYMTVSW